MSQLTTPEPKLQPGAKSRNPRNISNALQGSTLPKGAARFTFLGSFVLVFALAAFLAVGSETEMNIAAAVIASLVLYIVAIGTISTIIEGRRKAIDRIMLALVVGAFGLALLPLISVIWTVGVQGWSRLDWEFLSTTMQGELDGGGGVLHAIVGTLSITLSATLISVPIGLFTAIYLVEYGRGPLAKSITFLVDVMTGIPSIVAGLFAYALFSMIFGAGTRSGLAGAVALSVLMIPIIVRSCDEMLRLVPNELREASLALGVPQWLTILKVVLPTSIAGITTGIIVAIARIIGETAPLLLVAGYTVNMNWNMVQGRMMTLPVFVYDQYKNKGIEEAFFDARAWSGALVLILIVMILNLGARLIAHAFSPKIRR
ncbi:MAG: phosphate ABC transporter permease PstA [Microbacteriaceae bacterium]